MEELQDYLCCLSYAAVGFDNCFLAHVLTSIRCMRRVVYASSEMEVAKLSAPPNLEVSSVSCNERGV